MVRVYVAVMLFIFRWFEYIERFFFAYLCLHWKWNQARVFFSQSAFWPRNLIFDLTHKYALIACNIRHFLCVATKFFEFRHSIIYEICVWLHLITFREQKLNAFFLWPKPKNSITLNFRCIRDRFSWKLNYSGQTVWSLSISYVYERQINVLKNCQIAFGIRWVRHFSYRNPYRMQIADLDFLYLFISVNTIEVKLNKIQIM